MKRRALLATIVASSLPVAAGCVDGGGAGPNDGGTASETPTRNTTPTDELDSGNRTTSPTDADSPTDTRTPADDLGFTIDETTLQRGLVVPNTPDSIAVQHTDRTYLWMTLSVEHSPPERTDFRIEVPPKSYTALAADDRRPYRTQWGDERYYDGSTGTALLLFELPYRVESDHIEFQQPGSRVRSPAINERLARGPPPMDAHLERGFDGNEGEPVAVVATNEGDIPGRFLGAVNRSGGAAAYAPIARVSALLEPGETRTIPVSDPQADGGTPPPGVEPTPGGSYHLDWAPRG